MASKYMDMQIEITMRYLYTLNRISKMKKKKATMRQDGKLKFLCSTRGLVN